MKDKDYFYDLISSHLPKDLRIKNLEYSNEIDLNSFNLISDFKNNFMANEVNKLLLGKKKLLRPRLYLTNGSNYNIASTIELFHLATLIQDDVIDEADYRRFIPTINSLHGDKVAILVSDLLLIEILGIFKSEIDKETISYNKKNQELSKFIFDKFKLVINEMIKSEEGAFKVADIKSYNEYVTGKTANLFGLSYMLGFLNDGISLDVLKQKFELGVRFGVLFQKVDDYLDSYSSFDETGKEQLDKKNGINNFIVIKGNDKINIFNELSRELNEFAKLDDFKFLTNEVIQTIGGNNE